MNICLIGFGSIGKIYYDLIKKNFNFSNFYIVDNSIKFEKKIKNIYFFNKIENIPNKKNITHAIIATPSNLHFDLAKFFIKKRVNILIEKPFVLKSTDAKKLINMSSKIDRKCWVVFQNRTNKSIEFLKKLIANNFFGDITLIRGSLIWSRDFNYYNSKWRGKYSTDGGVLTNQSIHMLDIIYYLFGKITHFNSLTQFNKNKLEAEDLILINALLKDKTPVSICATTRANKDFTVELDLIGSKNRLTLNGISMNKISFFDNKYKKTYGTSYNEEFKKGFGKGHIIVLRSFFSKSKKDIFNLSIEKNDHIINFINSVYSNIDINNKKLFKVKKTNSILGK